MIPEKDRTIAIRSNIEAEGTAMSLDADATEHLIGLLTDLYSDPELAVVREYATNALDAHVEAGNSAPIEITLPSPLSPFYRVKDHGVGLSVDDLHDIYAKYGRSTKRETNGQVGMLGLGCKSALTYTDQFTLVSRKDGAQATVSITRGENGVGTLTVVDTSSTDEPNGVEVIVPVKSNSQIERKARDFFRFWKPGTVLVNDEQPEPISGMTVGEKAILSTDLSSDFIVMGNVAYRCNLDSHITGMGYSSNIVAWVEIGDVHFTPSREDLHLTTKTQATLERVAREFRAALPEAFLKHIDAQADRPSAMREALAWRQLLPQYAKVSNNKLVWRGVELPAEFKLANDQRFVTTTMFGKLSGSSNVSSLYAASYPNTVFVTDYDRTSFTAGQKKKLQKWTEDKGLENINGFALLPGKVPVKYRPFIPAAHIIDWATIAAIKLPRNAPTGPSGRIPGSYDLFADGRWQDGVPADDIDTTKPLYYVVGSYHEYRRWRSLLEERHGADGYTIVPMYERRVAKFLRYFPKAIQPQDGVQADFDKWARRVTAEQRKALAVQQMYAVHDLEALDEGRIEDPELSEYVRLSKLDVSKVKAKHDEFQRFIPADLDLPEVESPLAGYPLAREQRYYSRGRRHSEHVYCYLNAAYREGLVPKPNKKA